MILRQIIISYPRRFYTQIYPVQKRMADPAKILLNLRRSTGTFLHIRVISARAWIHCRHQHKSSRERIISMSSRYLNLSLFQRLSEHLKHTFAKLRELIQEENSSMGQADLSRSRDPAPSDQCSAGCCMMYFPEGPCLYQRLVLI